MSVPVSLAKLTGLALAHWAQFKHPELLYGMAILFRIMAERKFPTKRSISIFIFCMSIIIGISHVLLDSPIYTHSLSKDSFPVIHPKHTENQIFSSTKSVTGQVVVETNKVISTIYPVFLLQEAARLISPASRSKEAIVLGLGTGAAVEGLVNNGYSTSILELDPEIQYRLKACPELSLGIFIRKFEDNTKSDEAEDADGEIKEDKEDGETAEDDADEDAEEADKGLNYRLAHSTLQSEQLIGHIIATKTNAFNVSDPSMEIPELDSYGRIVSPNNDPRGHHEEGRTIAIHSVVIDPDYQGQAIGTTLLNDYIQRMSTLKHADRFALLAHERLIPFYERVGFESKGLSECKFSGGGWYDLQAPLVADD
ncbi:hypothetical protein DV113_000887 [Geotrichum candidum]|nr:hypothetical protein DV452_002452 [Geotrichum candidum]KAF7501044.1 hypothetical protein DV113_000887 [Geotrichum candidum]KAI8135724.1 hypothetical protein DUD61_000654 [Geotrichum candidum]